ncbi:hypothetical protein JL720_912 [Aureococcus anophagefferens]|nr:hypothetical protein JL720_912 [Aureococcus anophagefferens]
MPVVIADARACAPSLRILSVSGNKLTGPVPPWLLRGDHLWKAYLHANALSGPLPEAYGANLEWLSLYSNALTGPLPESLGELQHLRTFAVYENKLDGTVPASLVNLSRLEYLGLNANGFAGGLPGGPYGPMLRALWLQDNDFGGALPPAIGSCPLLEILDARNGGFDGPIPEAYGRLELLRDLFLDNNAFSGTIPDAVAQLPALPAPLRKLHLRRNALTGPLPSLSLAANLAELDVARNALVGVVPCDLLALPLASLDVEGNALVGVDAGCGICDDGLTCALDGNPPETLNDLPFRSDEDRRVALDECARVLERRAKPRPFPLVLAVDLRVAPLLVQRAPDGTGATILGNAMDLNLMSLATRPASSKASSENAALERAASSVSGDSERAVLLANAGVRDPLRAGRGAPSLDSLGDLELSKCSGRTADERPPAPLRRRGRHAGARQRGVLLRWCVFPGHGVRDVAAAVLTAARVPLPFESLWLVAFNADTGLAAWLPDARTRAALEAAGRLQYTSDVDVVVKATSVDGAAYRAAKRSLVRARDAQRGLAAATEAVRRRARDVRAARGAGGSEDAEAEARAAMDALLGAQATYARLKADIRADGAVQTYALGRRERAARRRLGLLDERALRHGARLRLVHIGHRDDGSPLSRVAEDVVNIVVAFLGSPADAGHGGLAPPPPPRRF